MIMLAPLLAAGVLLLSTRKTYLVDVATADVSERAIADAKKAGGSEGAAGQPG